jgi:hypothetical protein
MQVHPRIRNTTVRVAWTALLLAAFSGCGMNAANTVTVEITGVTTDAERERVQEALKGMADGSTHAMTYTSSGNQMTVNLSPVSDVQKFSQKINFGKVTEVKDRTVKVTFGR